MRAIETTAIFIPFSIFKNKDLHKCYLEVTIFGVISKKSNSHNDFFFSQGLNIFDKSELLWFVLIDSTFRIYYVKR